MVQRRQQRWAVWLALTGVMMLAFTSVAAANGYNQLQLSNMSGGNPAAIGQQGFLRLLAGGSVGLGNNVLHPAELLENLQGSEVDQEFLDLLPPEGARVWLDNANGIELGIGPIEVRTRVHLTGTMQVTPDLIELDFNEPAIGRTYHGDGTEATWGGYATLSAGGSLGLPAVANSLGWYEFRIGARVHALSGVGYGRAEVNGTIEIEEDDIAGVLVGELWDRPSETSLWTAGQGYAFDVGIQGQLSERWNVSVAVANIGRLTWNDVHYQRFESEIDLSAGSGDLELVWNQVAEETQTVVWHLPRRIEGTLGFRATDTLTVGAGLVQTTYFNQDGRPADARTDLSANVVWRGVPFLPLSAGVTYSGSSGWLLTTGAALDLGPLYVVAQVDSVPLPNIGREVGVSFGAGLSF